MKLKENLSVSFGERASKYDSRLALRGVLFLVSVDTRL